MSRGQRVVEVLLDYLPRIEAAARELADAGELVKTATQRRNRLIVEAADAGISQKAIARAAGIGQSRVIGILGEPENPDNDDEREQQ